jgi:hypothetical protein
MVREGAPKALQRLSNQRRGGVLRWEFLLHPPPLPQQTGALSHDETRCQSPHVTGSPAVFVTNAPTISNLPTSSAYDGRTFTATVVAASDRVTSATATPGMCTAIGPVVSSCRARTKGAMVAREGPTGEPAPLLVLGAAQANARLRCPLGMCSSPRVSFETASG